MKFLKQLGLDILKILIEVFMASLVLCTVTAASVPSPACYLWVALLAVYGVLGVLLFYLLPGLRLLQITLGVILSVAGTLGEFFLLGGSIPLVGFMGFIAIVVTLRARVLAEKEWDDAAPAFLYTVFMVFTLIFALLIGLIPMLEPFRPIATALGPLIVIVGLLTMNSLNLYGLTDVQRNTTSAGAMAVSAGMGRQNKLLLVVIFLAVLLVSALGGIGRLLSQLVRMLASLISFKETPIDEGNVSSGGGMDKPDMSGLAEAHVRNPFWVQVEEIAMQVIAWIAVVGAAIFLLVMIYKGLRRLIAYLKTVDWFAVRAESDVQEYEDTRESLMDMKDLPREYLKRAGDWLSERLKREPSWNDMKTNAEKARSLYRRAVLKARSGGYKENKAFTPSQTLKAVIPYVKAAPQSLDALRDCYEEARYGEREPDGAAVEKLNREI